MALLAQFPPAVIFVNNDLTNQVKNTIVRQLKIDIVLDGYEFDAIIAADGYWVDTIRNIEEKRVLVKRPLYELQNREYADIVAFVSHGLITVEKNKFGPPINSYPVAKIHWGQLCIFVRKNGPQCVTNKSSCNCCANPCCTMRQELDALNGRICSGCSCCGSCCNCPKPTYKTLLVPRLPGKGSGV